MPGGQPGERKFIVPPITVHLGKRAGRLIPLPHQYNSTSHHPHTHTLNLYYLPSKFIMSGPNSTNPNPNGKSALEYSVNTNKHGRELQRYFAFAYPPSPLTPLAQVQVSWV